MGLLSPWTSGAGLCVTRRRLSSTRVVNGLVPFLWGTEYVSLPETACLPAKQFSATHSVVPSRAALISAIQHGTQLADVPTVTPLPTFPMCRLMHIQRAFCCKHSACLHAGIAAWTCHQPSSVFDVVPGDLVSSTILAAAAATTQVSHMLPVLL